MTILNPAEKAFLDVFLHEVTTEPFGGPATCVLHGLNVYYKDISNLAWAYQSEVGMIDYQWGHAADVAPPLPWPDRETVLRRDKEIEAIRLSQEKARKRAAVLQGT